MKLFDTAIVIAGGKSTRMGFDKAFMKIGNTSCIELIVEKLKKHFNEIVVVFNKPNKCQITNIKVAYDEMKNTGPIGGLHAGLKVSNSLYNYLIACDMPIISDELIIYMKNLLLLKPDIIACKNKNFIEPFHAVYGTHLIAKIEQEIKRNKHSLFNLMSKSTTEVISYSTVTKICKNSNIFTNLNTRQDLDSYISGKVRYI